MGLGVLIERAVVLSYFINCIPHLSPRKTPNCFAPPKRRTGGSRIGGGGSGRGPPDPFWSTGQRRRRQHLFSLSLSLCFVGLPLSLCAHRRGCFIGTSLAPRMKIAAVGFRSRARNVVRHAALPADPVVHPQAPPPRQFPPGQG